MEELVQTDGCFADAFNASMRPLRQFIAILLLTLFGLPFASALFALTPQSEANLPACCRRGGKHHCMMSMAERRAMTGRQRQFSAPQEKCPCCPQAMVIGHQTNTLGAPSVQAIFAGFSGQAAVIAQTESKRRISRDRSRQKRGPPSSSPIQLS